MRTTTVAVGVGDLQVAVGQPAGQVLDRAGALAVRADGVEQRGDRRGRRVDAGGGVAGDRRASLPAAREPLHGLACAATLTARRRSTVAACADLQAAPLPARPCPDRDHRRRGGRRERRPPPRRARRARRAARRARRADQRVDVPLRRAGRPAAGRPGADPDERAGPSAAVPASWRRRRRRAPGWVESGSLRLASSPAAAGGDPPAGGWAQRAGLPLELISADEARRAVPADVHRRRAGRGVHADRRPGRPGAAVLRAGRAAPGPAGVTIAQRTRVTAITTAEGAGDGRAHRPRRRRVRGGRRLRRDVRRRDRPRWSASGCRSCRCRTSTW